MSNYLQVVLLVPADEVYYYYSITCLTAPFAGVIAGGFMFSLLGGYNDSRSYLLADIVGLFAVLVATPVPFLTTKWPVYIMMWMLLFFGSFILPTVTGMMLNSVPLDNRATANALAVLAYNLLGYLPAPFIYGWISTFGVDPKETDPFKKQEAEIYASRWAMGVLLFWTVLSVMSLWFGSIYELNKRQDELTDE
jgi:MFS family permease